jgi:hypothetical protein
MKLKNIFLVAMAIVLPIFGFNCSQSGFMAKKEQTSMSSISSYDSINIPGMALQNFEQVFQSMLNLTGQVGAVTNAQMNSYNTVQGSLPEGSDLSLISAPVLLSASSLAGEMCNGLLTRETALAQASRSYFPQVDFTKAVDQLSEDGYLAAMNGLSHNFISRDLSADELTLFRSFRSEFVSGLPAADKTRAQQTRNLMLSSCAALLSSFEVLSY